MPQRRVDRALVGEIAAQAEVVLAPVELLYRRIDIQSDHRSAAREQGGHAGLAYARSRAGDQGDFAAELGRRAAFFQLGLFQIPVFDFEQVARGQGAIAAQSLGALHHLHIVFVQLGDDGRVLGAAPGCGQTKVRRQDHARRRIEHGLRLLGVRRMFVEIRLVAARIGVHVLAQHGHALGADDMVGRDRPLLRQRLHIRALRKRERLGFGMGRHD